MEYFFDNYVITNTAPRTQRYYADIIRLHILPQLGELKLCEIKPSHLQSYYSYLITPFEKDGANLSKSTANKHHKVICKALNEAMKWGIIHRNVTNCVNPPKPEKKEFNIPTPIQVNRILETCKNSAAYIPIYLAATHGLRIGEICGLQEEDVDLKERFIYVRNNYQRIQGKMTLTSLKTSSSKRKVVILNESVPVLQKYILNMKKNKLSASTLWNENNFFCVWSEDGRPVINDYVGRVFRKALKELKIEGIRFHDLRHFHATELLKRGYNPKIVAERLGHSTIEMTLDIYSHVLPDIQKQVANENILGIK
jgi:integrase